MRVLVVLAATFCWAVSAWCSRGTIAFTGAAGDATRLGVLPPLGRLALLGAVALVIGLSPRVRCLRLAPLFLSGLAILPWIPGVPSPFLVWTGPMTRLVWTAALAGLVVAHDWRAFGGPASRVGALARNPRRAPLVAAAAAFVIFSAAAWLVRPSVPGGDEPHYLIITQSLLHDFDLKIENNHRQREYARYFSLGDLKPDFLRRGKDGEIYSIHAPGLPALIAPAFAVAGYPGVKVFLLIIAALGTALVWMLGFRVGASAGAAWFAWAAVSLSTSSVFHAFAVYPDGLGGVLVLVGVWALVRFDGEPSSESPGARQLALYGAALALLPWLHSRFALLAGVLGALVVLRIVQRHAPRHASRGAMWHRSKTCATAIGAFAVVPVLSAAAWFAMFYAIYGTPDPLVVYGGSTQGRWAYVTSGLGGLLFDQQFGLLPYSPVLIPALLGVFAMLGDGSRRRLGLEILLVMTPYLLSVTHFRMWWAGWSAPARFFLPVLLLLAAPAAVVWTRASRGATRATLVVALGFTLFAVACLVLVDGGRLAYNIRDGYGLWLEWLSRVADLPRGLPSFHRTPEAVAWRHVIVWAVCLLGGWLLLRASERVRARGREWLAVAAPAVFAAAVMAALTVVWRSNGASGFTPTPAQLELLRAAADPHAFAVQLGPLGRLDLAGVPARLTIETSPRYLQSRDRPLFVLPEIPAGSYALHVETGPNPSGEIQVGIARDGFALRSLDLASAVSGPTKVGPYVAPGAGPSPSAPLRPGPSTSLRAGPSTSLRAGKLGPDAARDVATLGVEFPVNVRAIIVHGDDPARASVTRVALVPRALVDPSRRATDQVARQAVRYPAGTAYFFDDGAFPEPEAFWVRGGRMAAVAIDTPGKPAAGGRRVGVLFLRNAPVENQVTLDTGAWREELTLMPGEERTVDVPLASDRSATLVRIAAASGFRPVERDPSNRDSRFLGVWVQLR